MVQAQAMAERRRRQIAAEAVLVLEAVAENGAGPAALPILALIFETSAVDIREGGKRKIDVAVDRRDAPCLHHLVEIQALVVIFEAGKTMLPSCAAHADVAAGEKVILPGALIEVGRE